MQSSFRSRTDLDVLRIFACTAVIVLHALIIFSFEETYHLKSKETSHLATFLMDALRGTSMPLFFIIAGYAALSSLRTRDVATFAKERSRRLLVPFIVGTVLFGSIIKYIELRQGRALSLSGFAYRTPLGDTFFEFFPRNLRRANQITWSHLWFLLYLFLMSVPFAAVLKRLAERTPLMHRPSAFLVFVPLLVLPIYLALTNGYWPYFPNLIGDVSNLIYFTLCFAIGAMLAAWPGFEETMRGQRWWFVGFAVVGLCGIWFNGPSTPGRIFMGITAWSVSAASIGFAALHAPADTPVLRYFRQATLPVFIIHHVPLLWLGLWLIPMAMPVASKVVVIATGTIAISLAAYHLLIRPWKPMRLLFGG
ncbi:glucans biosynthesis protein C [Variibacter gotjawalensis]|uniref:Glucans biosynthesis protein C n=1 Tax=Variibacter gotjawalensis TaxID=1333996 RepID=A0A0S3PYE7_9BRAD|nr:acyltransferase [Variibacter gotjawalensis]NIK46766.1 peptidoglycan/LPS O-acetylase OafA/YrhL [Variibacter gotjawalensis]RZS48670.1 acyltransferase-like protein [Variibacter gotjawalensis]BAT60930.1 glucans biosynthesis protein C [Variibacter gotjawalensis]